MTTNTRHDDPTIDAFLADGDYLNIDEWMSDSGYFTNDAGDWFYPLNYVDPAVAGAPVDPEDVIEGAIEACGFEAPHAFADRVRSLLNAEGIDRL